MRVMRCFDDELPSCFQGAVAPASPRDYAQAESALLPSAGDAEGISLIFDDTLHARFEARGRARGRRCFIVLYAPPSALPHVTLYFYLFASILRRRLFFNASAELMTVKNGAAGALVIFAFSMRRSL